MKASLITGEAQPVKSLCIKGKVHDGMCIAAFRAEFENKQDHPIEISFTFPLPAGVCSTKFKVKFGDQKIVSQVARDENARYEYDDAIAGSDFAAIAQTDDKNELRIDAGPLAPKEMCTVSLYFEVALSPFANGYSLVLPTSITSYSDSLRVGLHPPPLQLKLKVTDSLPIKSITTPFTKANIDGKTGLITSDSLSIFYPFHLVITLQDKLIGRCIYQKEGEKTFLNVTATTPRAVRNHPSQFSILIESGAQLTGGQQSLVARSLEFLVLSIPNHCKFNIAHYGFSSDLLFEKPQELDNDFRAKALNFIKNQNDDKPTSADFNTVHQNLLKNVDIQEMESIVLVIGSSLPYDIDLLDDHQYFFMDPFSTGSLRALAQEKGAIYIPVPDEQAIISAMLLVIKLTASEPIQNATLNLNDDINVAMPAFKPGFTFSTLLSIDGVNVEKASLNYGQIMINLPILEAKLPIIHHIWAYEKMKFISSADEEEMELAKEILNPDQSSVAVIERDEEIEGDITHVESKLSKIGMAWVSEEKKIDRDDQDNQPQPPPAPVPPGIHPIYPIHPHPHPHPGYPHILPMPRRPFHNYGNPQIFPIGLITKVTRNGNNKAGIDSAPMPELFFGELPARPTNRATSQVLDASKPQNAYKPDSPPPPSQKSSGTKPFFLLRLMQLQESDGSWVNENKMKSCCGFEIPLDNLSLTRVQFLTAFAIACFHIRGEKEIEKWELVVEKALTYLQQSDESKDWNEIVAIILSTLVD